MASLRFPPPTDHQEFERLVSDVAGPVFRTPRVALNGRSGQKQQGVDISAITENQEHIGIQCKLTSRKLSLATVKQEIAKARGYLPSLNRFIIATTAAADARLQEAVRQLPAEAFTVDIWSWETINNYLNRLPGVGLAYAQHVMLGPAVAAELEHAQHLREALDRPAFLRIAHSERNFLAQRAAAKDTSTFLRTGYLYTRDRAFVSGLPYPRYSEQYSAALAVVVQRVDYFDSCLGVQMMVLNDSHHPKHDEALKEVDRRRKAVLTAANKIFKEMGVARL